MSRSFPFLLLGTQMFGKKFCGLRQFEIFFKGFGVDTTVILFQKHVTQFIDFDIEASVTKAYTFSKNNGVEEIREAESEK